MMQMSNKIGKRVYFVFGILFLAFSIFVSSATISIGVFPAGHELVLFGVSVMAFCLSYLYSHFKQNDECSKLIREKGMFYSYFFILGYMLILMVLSLLNMINTDSYQTVSLLASLTIITVFSSFVVLTKRY